METHCGPHHAAECYLTHRPAQALFAADHKWGDLGLACHAREGSLPLTASSSIVSSGISGPYTESAFATVAARSAMMKGL
jgi:hypothetical protein